MLLHGIHHLTAISADIRRNHDFYTRTLGMRLVKRSVNQDDVSAYHLFYADAVGSPGTDLTFFDWPVAPERRGTNSVVRTSLRVRGADTLAWWARRFSDLLVECGEVTERDGRLTLDFQDPEGQRLCLLDDGGAGDEPVVWTRSSVPAEHQIRGLGPVVMSVPSITETEHVLAEVMRMEAARQYADPHLGAAGVHVFAMGSGGPAAELHVAVQPDLQVARQGAGGVHHVAFRTTSEEYDDWAERLNELRVPNSGKIDRYYFRSLYFREPNGVLFEIATDEPGFAVDEDPASLGEAIALPPFLEPRREEIVRGLKPLD
jgi:glyoxalase family protein